MLFVSKIVLAVAIVANSNVMATPLAGTEVEKGLKPMRMNDTSDSTQPPTHWFCGGRWGKFTNQAVMQDAISAENRIPGQSCVGAGPSACVTVSDPACYGGVAIRWCNDNKYNKCVLHTDLATRAGYTVNDCAGTGTYTGQTFYPDGTNTIVEAC